MADIQNNRIDKLIVVGDRVLIKPKSESGKTRSGLLLPPGYKEKEEIQSGFVVKTGPGYPIPLPSDDIDEPWKKKDNAVNYIPLQAQVGDLAIFLKKGAYKSSFFPINLVNRIQLEIYSEIQGYAMHTRILTVTDELCNWQFNKWTPIHI